MRHPSSYYPTTYPRAQTICKTESKRFHFVAVAYTIFPYAVFAKMQFRPFNFLRNLSEYPRRILNVIIKLDKMPLEIVSPAAVHVRAGDSR